MRIEEIWTPGEQEYDDLTLEIKEVYSGRLLLNFDDEQVKYLYRGVSKEEYEDIVESGVIKPSKFYGRIHASAIPVIVDSDVYVVLKIKYVPSDGWKPKAASTGVYAVTGKEIPKDRIMDKIPVGIARTEVLLRKTRMSQFMEFQT